MIDLIDIMEMYFCIIFEFEEENIVLLCVCILEWFGYLGFIVL